MNAPLPIPIGLQRLRYVTGQELRSADFLDALANEAQMRWWHNRAKHHSYGVAQGLSVTLGTSSDGETGLRVAPGIAYDCFGRELFFCVMRVIGLPESLPEGRVATLLLRAPEPRRGSVPHPSNHGGAFCKETSPADYLGEEAQLGWDLDPVPDVRSGVPIARIRRGSDPAWMLESLPFGARAAARPRIGRGVTIRGATDWRLWTANAGKLFLGVETVVDTSAAGFTRAPYYFANYRGERIPGELARAFLTSRGFGLPVPLLHLTDSASDRFTARVFFPFNWRTSTSSSTIQGFYRRDIALCWIGIEPLPNGACVREFS